MRRFPETIAELEDLSLTVRPHQLESRMRESRLSGSEGGGGGADAQADALPTPISVPHPKIASIYDSQDQEIVSSISSIRQVFGHASGSLMLRWSR
jgi:hypothetical protein